LAGLRFVDAVAISCRFSAALSGHFVGYAVKKLRKSGMTDKTTDFSSDYCPPSLEPSRFRGPAK
jgi:hypothetical protein